MLKLENKTYNSREVEVLPGSTESSACQIDPDEYLGVLPDRSCQELPKESNLFVVFQRPPIGSDIKLRD